MKRKNVFFRFLSSRFFFIFSRAVSRGESKLTERLEEVSREGEKGASKLRQIMKWPFPPLPVSSWAINREVSPRSDDPKCTDKIFGATDSSSVSEEGLAGQSFN